MHISSFISVFIFNIDMIDKDLLSHSGHREAKSSSENYNFAIKFASPSLGYGNVRISNPYLSYIPKGLCTVVGDNGSGKSTLGMIMAKGRYAYGNRLSFPEGKDKVKMLGFSGIHVMTGVDVERHSQRLEATANDFVPTVEESFGKIAHNPRFIQLCEEFSIPGVLNKRVNYLSTGEVRKLLLINAIIDTPDILILDNPYLGLDSEARRHLDYAVKAMIAKGINTVMLLSDPADIPPFTDAVVEIRNLSMGFPIDDKEEILKIKGTPIFAKENCDFSMLPAFRKSSSDHDVAFSISNGLIRYGNKIVVRNLDFKVGRGECWALTGPNGSGKSLLLSMVCADHPQAYANDILLFDRKRGSGESIWEIKDRIGYFCPEMQFYVRDTESVLEIVARGKRKALSQHGPLLPEELDYAALWLKFAGIAHLSDRNFQTLSMGEQRLVLLLRTLIRQPDLLILDEPLHGLDAHHKFAMRSLIDEMARQSGCSMIFVSHFMTEIPSVVSHYKSL